MIQVQIKFVDMILLQNTMDQNFGGNVFQIIQNKLPLPKTFYLCYEETVDQILIDQAMTLVEAEAMRFLNKNKVRLYENVDILAEKLLNQNSISSFSESDYQIAASWLNDTTQSCPDIVILESLKNNVSTLEAAQNIVNKWTLYQSKLTQLSNLRISGKQNILAASELIELKTIATAAFDEMKALFQDN